MDTIRVGHISAINYSAGTARVVYTDRDEEVTQEIPFLDSEYKMPEIGALVAVAHLSNGSAVGIILGRPWSDKHKPPESGTALYRKDLGQAAGDAVIKYDGKTLTISTTGGLMLSDGECSTTLKSLLDRIKALEAKP